ncbi:MAG TPA: hypothetical protein VMV46_02140 [Thermoanaerobaculia bacterium]|nr:hypothetical protein [Thermoanaerobaculia bacterium]
MEEKSSKLGWVLFAIAGCGCLLVGTAVLGVVAAITIPNFVDAREKAKQKRTIADVRTVGTAWMSWLTDQVIGAEDSTALGPGEISAEELRELLVPVYISEVPASDGWGHPLELTLVESREGFELPTLRIRSPGRDGVFEAVPDPEAPGSYDAIDYDRDIVWQDGFFIQFPGGAPP